MRVRQIELTNFMVPGQASLTVPERGVVVVTGPNGAGKSRLVEAVSYAGWGRLLRESSPQVGELELEDTVVLESGLTFYRKTSAKGTKKTKVDGVSADTPTKTQEQLDALVGSHELWRRTHVFSSSDAANFSTATDSERKKMVELLLGLSVFDRAAEAVSGQVSRCQSEISGLKMELAKVDGLRRGLEAGLANWLEEQPFVEEPELPPLDRPKIMPGERELLMNKLRVTQEALQKFRVLSPSDNPDLKGVADRYHSAERDFRSAEKQWELTKKGNCPTCGTTFPRADVDKAQREVEHYHTDFQANQAQFQRVQALANAQFEAAQQQRRELEEDVRQLKNEILSEERLAKEWARYAGMELDRQARNTTRRQAYDLEVAARAARKRETEDALAEYKSQVTDCLAGIALKQVELAELEAVRRVFGARGLKAHVLGRALAGVQDVANAWLSRMSPGVEVRLSADEADGAPSEKLRFEVLGFGGGEGYYAMSGGERRRVDAAVLLALAEVAGASSGRLDGTLWMDEVFDALDEPGRAAVAECLGELGQSRAVVVITHREDLAAMIPSVARYRVEGGKIEAY